jgi:hypothetical protein
MIITAYSILSMNETAQLPNSFVVSFTKKSSRKLPLPDLKLKMLSPRWLFIFQKVAILLNPLVTGSHYQVLKVPFCEGARNIFNKLILATLKHFVAPILSWWLVFFG